jgi:hypothetical protein
MPVHAADGGDVDYAQVAIRKSSEKHCPLTYVEVFLHVPLSAE